MSWLCWGCSFFGIRTTPEPAYSVELAEGNYEIRRYAPYVVVSIVTSGDYRQSSNSGFLALADYIGGANSRQSEIAMTAPVLQQGQPIAMTAPVLQQAAMNGWEMAFILPPTYTRENAPQPTNAKLSLREQPAELVAAVRYAGMTDSATIMRNAEALRTWVAGRGYQIIGQPRSARYDPPFTLPWFRRNEVLLSLQPVDQ